MDLLVVLAVDEKMTAIEGSIEVFGNLFPNTLSFPTSKFRTPCTGADRG